MADMGVTETSATAVALVSAMVQKQLIAKAQFMFTVQDESARAVKGAKSVAFPRTGNLTPAAKAENTDSTTQALVYAVDTLVLNQHMHTLVKLEDMADVQSVVNIEADIIERAAAGMAKQMDTYIYQVLRDGASASAPDHQIGWTVSTDFTKQSILDARLLLDNQDVPSEDRWLAVSPLQEAELLKDANFIQAERYGSRDALLNGEIGRIFGFRVLKSTIVEADTVLAYHKSAAAFARQIEPKFEKDRSLASLADVYSLSSLYGAKILDAGKRNVTIIQALS